MARKARFIILFPSGQNAFHRRSGSVLQNMDAKCACGSANLSLLGPRDLDHRHGEVAEWSNAAVLKTVEVRASQGSNPCLSAINYLILFHFFKKISLTCLTPLVWALIFDFSNKVSDAGGRIASAFLSSRISASWSVYFIGFENCDIHLY